MGFFSRLGQLFVARYRRSNGGFDRFWDGFFGTQSATGININQYTALTSTAVMACVGMLSEDVAKLPVALYRRMPDGKRQKLKKKDHFLVALLRRPNSWQNWMEFCEQMQCALVLRNNAYAVIIRNGRGDPIMFVPVNPDWTAMWESPDGGLFYRVTPVGLHMTAMLRGQPYLIPADDVLHIKRLAINGLLGASCIALAHEAVALAIGQERQAAQLMGFGARPSGVLSTEQKLTETTAKRAIENWKNLHAGIANHGRTAILEAGLKWVPLTLTAQDMEFIESRKFQLQEIARMFRVPPHKIGELSKSTNNNIESQDQGYYNDTLSGYVLRWQNKFADHFDLDDDDLHLDFDLSVLLRANITARFNSHRTGIMSGFLTPNEARAVEGLDPKTGEEKGPDALQQPSNMSIMGSQSSGTGADGGGRPEEGTTP